jgi:threonine/homoserine/homoserine lactone efflux protein
MTLISILALAGAMLLLAITPGPGVFATVARGLASGLKQSAFVVLGIVTGDLVFLLFAIYGLATVAENLHGLFGIIKYAGAVYLIYLGLRLWLAIPEKAQIQAETEDLSWQSNFLTGLFITLGNPKVILFYLGFLPTFVDFTSLTGIDVGVIVTVVSLVLGLTMLVYAYAASRARALFQDARSERWLNRSAGTAMIATGSALAIKA